MPEEKVEQQWPIVLAMVLADNVHRDPSTGKFFILGTYDIVFAAAFPCRHPVIVVYLSITDGRGETPVKMKLVDVDEAREPVFEFDNTINFADPTQVVETVFVCPGPVFPEPGEYRLQFFAAGELVRERRLQVVPNPRIGPGEGEAAEPS